MDEREALLPLLLVEDDPLLRTQWAGELEDAGYAVRTAADPTQAWIEASRTPAPALALLDLGLPPQPGEPTEGLKLLQRLMWALPRLKVVVLTGQHEPAVSWRAIGMGAFDFLLKPAGRAQVLQSLERARLFVASERHALEADGFARITITAPLEEGVREFGEAAQERLVRAVMADCGHNVAQAARQLGLSRENLYYFLRKFGIQRPGE